MDISVRSESGRTSNPGSRARRAQLRSRDPPRPEQAGGDRGHEGDAEDQPRDVLRDEVKPHERGGIDYRRGKAEHPLGHHGDHEPDEARAPDRHSTERPEPTRAPCREAHEDRRDERREVALLEMADVLRDETARRHERDACPGDRDGHERLNPRLLDLAPESEQEQCGRSGEGHESAHDRERSQVPDDHSRAAPAGTGLSMTDE